MTYFQVLGTFIVPPMLILMIIVPQDIWRRLFKRQGQIDWLPYIAVLLHVVIAVVYTTPWDNYLVATNVWWYDPELVTGVRLGYVPIEEYTFFVLQTLLTGFWTLFLMRYVFKSPMRVVRNSRLRIVSGSAAAILWLASTALLLSGWESGTYLTLILSWALIPVAIQLFYGADLLLANWRLVTLSFMAPTIYLWIVDSLSISSGTWTINPAQTTGLVLGSLPMEEMLFFLMTNVIIVFGMTLLLSEYTRQLGRNLAQRRRKRKQALTVDPQ
jgi:lycopene cyclase domain-containing protein